MSTEKHSPQHEELMKRQALEQQEVKEVLFFIRKYAKPASIILIALCAVVLVNRASKINRHKKEIAADSALMNARSIEDFQAIFDDYPSTPSGLISLMGLARETFNSGLVDEAEALYTQFIKKHGDHELAKQAELNLIACKEANGQLSEAHLLYGKFVSEDPSSYLAPSAMLGEARCLEALGLLDEAQIAYEDIMVNYPERTWAQMAEANLKGVLGKK